MNQRKTLSNYIQRARRSLMVEQIMPIAQLCLLAIVVMSTLVLIVSRLFVFPYYRLFIYYSILIILLLTIVYIWMKRVRKKDALMKLDAYYPNNELVTSLSFDEKDNPLIQSLLKKAEADSPQAFQRFKNRKKDLWNVPVLISILVTSILLGVLVSFPSETQREAVQIEKEKSIIKDLKKEIAKLEKKAKNEENKKQIAELKNKLKDADSAEKAMREVLKKQKELKLQEEKLKQKNKETGGIGNSGGGLTKEQKEKMEELAKLQSELNKDLQNSKSALSEYGKTISTDLQKEIASANQHSNSQNNNSNNNASNNNGTNSSSNSSSQSNSNSTSSNNNSNNNSASAGSGNSSNNSNQGTNGNQSGNGNKGASGNGGKGMTTSNGTVQGISSGAGTGKGDRNLVSIPKRIGEKGEITTEGGPLSSGQSVGQSKGTVQATKGSVFPYEEVVGEYKNSYFESSNRMQLPKDLQSIVQSYFSSIEDD